MVLNILIGFVIPWIFGFILFTKNKKVVLVIVPIGTVIGYTLNEIGFHLHLWRLAPLNINDDLTSMSVNLGFYPILSCYLVYWMQKTKIKKFTIILIFALLNTIFEYIAFLLKLVSYGSWWNIVWTFISYIVAYSFIYWYYYEVEKNKIL